MIIHLSHKKERWFLKKNPKGVKKMFPEAGEEGV